MAKRIQRQRTKGWRMPEGAIYVGRPSWWGNNWRVGEVWDAPFVWHVASAADAIVNGLVKITPQIAVDLFRLDAARKSDSYFAPIRGRDLACWCPLDQPCHADVLLELANG